MSRRTRKPRRLPNAAVTESAYGVVLDGVEIDSDEHLWRSLTGSRGENLPQYKHEKMLGIAKYLYRTNPVANRFITLLSDFVLAEGVALSFRNDQVAEVVNRHWEDPLNGWQGMAMIDLFESYVTTGELLMPLFPNTATGHLRVGAVINENIDRVETHEENWREITAVRMKARTGETSGRVYSVVNQREDAQALAGADNPALFWKRANPFGSRGISILYPLADFLDLLDNMAYSEVERWILQKVFVWDVTLRGQNQAQVTEWTKRPENVTPPKAGTVRAHNDQEVWAAVSPNLDTYDATNGLRFLRNHALGAGGIPEHWYAEGGDVNRATGTVMAEPTRKRLTAIQNEWRDIVADILRAQVDYAVLYGQLPAEVAVQDSDGNDTEAMIAARDAVSVDMPDLSPADTQSVTTTLETLTRSLVLAIGEGFVTEGLARRLWLVQAGQLGVDFDVTEEAERAQAEAEEREQAAPQVAQPPSGPLVALAGGRQASAEAGD
ncbi:MAG: hypothetical protein NAOJABEB_02966 [Steroidobacteraceae bacterium]|nr:hypothetical protein [Steroidobacteraceae bacterium]